MKLEEIGFYTLSDNRAKNCNIDSPLSRCELILTDKCNFKCPYCRGLEHKGHMPFSSASNTIQFWKNNKLKNIRFSGGEPTLYPDLDELIKQCKGMEHIAISTNGTASLDYYFYLIECGVNDFSISLDACCASTGNVMSGKEDSFDKVIKTISELSKRTYVTVGIVFTEQNVSEISEIIKLADSLHVSDIRVIPAAQFDTRLVEELKSIPDNILSKYPILRYRIHNFLSNESVRGLTEEDSKRCYLVMDDMAVVGDSHYPCIIYLREKGNAIGNITDFDVRKDRYDFSIYHNCLEDEICRKNCLDVCRTYNNRVKDINPCYKN